MEQGPATAEAIETQLSEKANGGDSFDEIRLDDALRYLERERKITTQAADGKKIYMLTEDGLRELLDDDGVRSVAEIIISEFVNSAES